MLGCSHLLLSRTLLFPPRRVALLVPQPGESGIVRSQPFVAPPSRGCPVLPSRVPVNVPSPCRALRAGRDFPGAGAAGGFARSGARREVGKGAAGQGTSPAASSQPCRAPDLALAPCRHFWNRGLRRTARGSRETLASAPKVDFCGSNPSLPSPRPSLFTRGC